LAKKFRYDDDHPASDTKKRANMRYSKKSAFVPKMTIQTLDVPPESSRMATCDDFDNFEEA
jgi:hypothetical protein